MATASIGTPENKVEAIYAKKIYADSYNGIPVGIPLPMPTNGEVPAGFVEYNGASLSRAMYPDLFAFLGTAYGAEDELHFNVPDLRGKFLMGAEVAGEVKEAGLPNIEGVFSANGLTFGTVGNTTGALGKAENPQRNGVQYVYADNSQSMITLDASKSNPIYGNSNTVQPPAITCRWIARAFDAATPDSALVDMTQVANELNGKANRSLTNVDANVDFVVDSYRDNDGNWYRKYKSGWVKQGGRIKSTTILHNNHYPISYLVPMSFYDGYVFSCSSNDGYQNNFWINLAGNTTTTLACNQNTAGSKSFVGDIIWYACGMGADV